MRDRFTPSYFLLVTFVFLLFWWGNELDRIFHLYVLLPPVLFFPALIVTVAVLVGAIRASLRRRWRRLASIVAAPPLAWALLASLSHMGFGPDWVHLQLQKRTYLEQIARCECGPVGLRFKTFDWGGTGGVAVANTDYTLIYDESDEIALPADTRTAGWNRKAGSWARWQPGPVAGDAYHSFDLRALRGHFYLVTEIYQG
jgi:hypothetical protein